MGCTPPVRSCLVFRFEGSQKTCTPGANPLNATSLTIFKDPRLHAANYIDNCTERGTCREEVKQSVLLCVLFLKLSLPAHPLASPQFKPSKTRKTTL